MCPSALNLGKLRHEVRKFVSGRNSYLRSADVEAAAAADGALICRNHFRAVSLDVEVAHEKAAGQIEILRRVVDARWNDQHHRINAGQLHRMHTGLSAARVDGGPLAITSIIEGVRSKIRLPRSNLKCV